MSIILIMCLNLVAIPGGLFEMRVDPAKSIVGMKGLVDMEGFFISELTNYAKELKDKIDTIESFLQDVQSKREISRRNPKEFVAHPLNAFSLIRRLHEDWTHIELYMSEKVGMSHLTAIKNGLDEAQPTDEDLKDAIDGIISLHRFYNLQPADIAKGLLMGKQYNAHLTTINCQAIAIICLNMNYDRDALNWYKTAVEQYDDDRDGQVYREVFDFKLRDLYINYVSTLVVKGFRKAAHDVLRNVSDLDATLWLLHKDVYEVGKIDVPDPTFIVKPWVDYNGCQGFTKRKKYFSCHYERGTSAFLKMAPLKVETLSLNPHIVIYHDVIYDSEISRLKNISLPSLKSPPTYLNGEDYNLKYSKVQEVQESPLNRRIGDMTGENVKEDTDLLINNFGICGFRYYHTDNLEEQDQTAVLGDRLTSIIFFLNDVDLGGAISFPHLHLSVFPRKGSALVWRNLDQNLQPNEDLLHLSCPVVVGSKWTLVKWLHEKPQIFHRPCKKEFKEFNK
ncbi:prolyl 4-hydroxylase subunit alpha-1 [Drosophila biarmipes]|uniref:prolyl 4-hydroxylase subunit alpha-1 n=1 Tax=Drosophila biarmipes TaxID=125945 RepID=UPI0007E639A9|nr:prolyl 4-hydroxylase subunit alpha-1 [Drosophila biarmipes]